MQGDGVTADAFRTRATGLVDQGELGEAIDVATRAVELAPDDVQSWAVLAYVQLLARDNAQQARAAEDDDRLTGCE
jgi:Flp pilus assembly protein TadD